MLGNCSGHTVRGYRKQHVILVTARLWSGTYTTMWLFHFALQKQNVAELICSKMLDRLAQTHGGALHDLDLQTLRWASSFRGSSVLGVDLARSCQGWVLRNCSRRNVGCALFPSMHVRS